MLEAATHAALLVGMLALLFVPAEALLLPTLTFLALFFAAVRLSPRLVAIELVALGSCAAAATMLGRGVFAAPNKWPALLYLVACAMTALPLALAVDHRRQALARAEAGERLWQQGFDDSLLGMLLVRLTGNRLVVERANQSAHQLLQGGCADGEVALQLAEVLVPGDAERLLTACQAMTAGELAGWRGELQMVEGVSTSGWVDAVVSAVDQDSVGNGARFTVQVVDATGRQVEERLTGLALHDDDAARHACKTSGRHQAIVDEHRWRAARAVQLEEALKAAMRSSELLLHVQPIFDLETGMIVAGEMLARWQHPERGLLLPGDWLEVAEQSSLIHELGHWVLREACRMGTQWAETVGDGAPAVHVNISARQFERGDLCQRINGLLDESGLPGHKLVLELAETHLDRIDHSLARDIEALARRGVVLAADDFGTGYSPLTRVADLPVQMLKIDRKFVMGLGHDARASAVVHAAVGIGRALGLQLIAVGVETPAQAEVLKELGCTWGQGYLWSPPRPAESFLTQVRAQHRGPARSAARQLSRPI